MPCRVETDNAGSDTLLHKESFGQSPIPRKLLATIAASFLCFAMLGAQEKNDQGFEIVARRARVQFFPQSQTLECADTLTLRLLKHDMEHLELRFLRFYTMKSVLVDWKKKDVSHKGDLLLIDDVPSDSLTEIVISYSGNFPSRSEFSGFGSDRAVLREEDVFLSGPKAYRFVRLTLVAPREWTTIAVGRQMLQKTTGDTTVTVWEFDQALSTIGWICAGKYSLQAQDTGEVPISTHLFQEDSASATGLIPLAAEALHYYSKTFSPYRFSKLAIVEVDDWFAGRNALAVASPSFIMVKKLALTTKDKYNQADVILPHEIAHQWWPITVFVEERDVAFLSEGLCEYSSLLFNESKGMVGKRDSLGSHPLLHSLMSKIANGKDLPLQQKTDLRAVPTLYLKSSYVHNMLRRFIGDSLFMKLYHEYATRFSLRKASLEAFQRLAEELSGKNLEWFFDQWVKKRGVPRMKIYNVKSSPSGAKWVTRGRVRMLGYDKYTTFVDVAVNSTSAVTRARVFLGVDGAGLYHNDAAFEVVSDEKPTTAVLDPQSDILKMQKLSVKLTDLRDPSDGIMIVGTLDHKDYLLERARKDSALMGNSGWSFTIKYDSSVTLADLQRERVFLYGREEENSVVADLSAKFPMHVRGDSISVKGETISDSNLTLIQIIESPYIADGTVCWVAPFSDRAEPELLPYDASWTLVRGKDEISSGIWEVKDEDLVVEIK